VTIVIVGWVDAGRVKVQVVSVTRIVGGRGPVIPVTAGVVHRAKIDIPAIPEIKWVST